jgi:16S rRNA (adenine1518-N6/adenine1519-N6)-dimethyltransferase
VDAILKACAADAGNAAAILEIGPGRGALTAGLAALGTPFFAVEKDYDLTAQLTDRFSGLNVALGDARELDLSHIAAETKLAPWLVVGNLPYNAGTDILCRILAAPQVCSACVVMLQREVAWKFCKEAGSEGYGPLSAWTAAWWMGEVLFTVPQGAFHPPPKVTSAVCRFAPRGEPGLLVGESGRYRGFLRKAFAQPRKTLAANLADVGCPKVRWAQRLEQEGLSANVRPAQVAPEVFERLYLGHHGRVAAPERVEMG